MKHVESLAGSFSRSALRQPIFAILLFVPPLIGLGIRPLPGLLEHYLPKFDFSEWIPLFLAVTAGFPAYLYGFLASLILLDERDQDLLPAIRVTPLTDRGLIAAKLLPAMILALTGTPITLALSGQIFQISLSTAIAAAIIAVPSTAFYALIGTALARNKVQGISIGKVMGMTLLAPVLPVILPAPWSFLALLFPPAWIGRVLREPAHQGLWAVGGLLYTSVLAMLTWRWAMKRYFTE